MTLTEAVKGTYAVVGQAMTDTELAMIVTDLSAYAPDAVLTALTRCRRELKRIALSDIIDRLPGGHPGPEEAWALVAKAMNDESISIAWTAQMQEAMGVALGLKDDMVAARMAFKECYVRLISEARSLQVAPVWQVSLGWDPRGRELAERDVQRRNLLAHSTQALLVASHAPKKLQRGTHAKS